MEQIITFNGKIYRSIDEMPPDVRQAYESVMQIMADKNQNGVPDLFEGLAGAGTQQTGGIIYNGQAYSHLDDLPPEARAKYEAMLGKWDADHNGLPDFAEKVLGTNTPTISISSSSQPSREPDFFQPSAPTISPAPNIEPEQTGTRFGILAMILVLMLCLGAIAFYFLYTQR